MLATSQKERGLCHRFANTFGHRSCSHYISIGQDDRKLLAAIAAHDIHAANLLAQPHRKFSQHIISTIMTIFVVHALEMVKVDHND